MLGEKNPTMARLFFETDAVRMADRSERIDDCAIVSFKSKLHSIRQRCAGRQ
jgi:hypothetical protein